MPFFHHLCHVFPTLQTLAVTCNTVLEPAVNLLQAVPRNIDYNMNINHPGAVGGENHPGEVVGTETGPHIQNSFAQS
jgi:hypothetical protein